MYTIEIQVTDAHKQRLIDAFGYDYEPTISQLNEETGEYEEVANPQGKGAFAKGKLIEYIKNFVINHERSVAAQNDIDIT